MSNSRLKKRASKLLRFTSICFLFALLVPVVVSLAIANYILTRYGEARKKAVFKGSKGIDEVKTMADLMEIISSEPLQTGRIRLLYKVLFNISSILPSLLDAFQMTAGILYPYPDDFEPVIIKSRDGTLICGMKALHSSNKLRPGIIVVHDYFSNKNSLPVEEVALKAFYDWGFNVYAIDLRDSGDSTRFSEAPTSWGYRESEDILAAAEYMLLECKTSSVGIYGIGLGASSALLASAEAGPQGLLKGGLVAVNPFLEAGKVVEYISEPYGGSLFHLATCYCIRLFLWLKTVMSGPRPFKSPLDYTKEVSSQYYELSEDLLFKKSSASEIINEVDVPCLVLCSEDDRFLPDGEAEGFYSAALNNPMLGVVKLPFGNHSSHQVACRKWFFNTLRTFFTYWGEAGPENGPEGNTGKLFMFGNTNN